MYIKQYTLTIYEHISNRIVIKRGKRRYIGYYLCKLLGIKELCIDI